MSTTNEFDIELVRIDEIIITNAAIVNNTELATLEKNNYYFDINYGFTIGINLLQKKLRIIFSSDLKTFRSDDSPVDITGRFDIAFYFLVDNLESLVTQNDDLQPNSDLIVSLANISYSTSRGIIYTRCQGTIMKNIILPILSNKRLIEILQPQEDVPKDE